MREYIDAIKLPKAYPLRKRNIGSVCECIANSMVTCLKFLLTYSMKFVKIYSIK